MSKESVRSRATSSKKQEIKKMGNSSKTQQAYFPVSKPMKQPADSKKRLHQGVNSKYTDTEMSALAKYPSNTNIITPFGKHTDVETALLPDEPKRNEVIEVSITPYSIKGNNSKMGKKKKEATTEAEMSSVPEERSLERTREQSQYNNASSKL